MNFYHRTTISKPRIFRIFCRSVTSRGEPPRDKEPFGGGRTIDPGFRWEYDRLLRFATEGELDPESRCFSE
jgi:hypothetical protein